MTDPSGQPLPSAATHTTPLLQPPNGHGNGHTRSTSGADSIAEDEHGHRAGGLMSSLRRRYVVRSVESKSPFQV
jgi:hypothetical protein